MIFRSIEEADLRQLQDLVKLRQEVDGYSASFAWSPDDLYEEWLKARSWGGFEETGELRAFILYRTLSHGEVEEITCLATQPGFEGHGIMTSLVKNFLCQLVGVREIWLEVHEKNQIALHLYQKMGFEIGGRRLRYYRDQGTALLLKLNLAIP